MYISQMVINDVFDKQSRGIDVSASSYNCFEYEEIQKGCLFYSNSIKILSTRIITAASDGMGSDQYLFNLFGLNMNDLYAMDYASFVEIEKTANVMTEANIKQLEIKNAKLEGLKQDTK